jgi:hypothetical protein
MKLSNGFTKIAPSVAMFVFYILSLVALTYALKKIEVSMAYAIWSGVGTGDRNRAEHEWQLRIIQPSPKTSRVEYSALLSGSLQ